MKQKRITLYDDDRRKVSAGDCIYFHYGIPQVRVNAKIVQRGKSLIALTPGHNPKEVNLRSLRWFVGGWFKLDEQDAGLKLRTRKGA